MNKTQIQNKKFDVLKEIRNKRKKTIDTVRKIEKICFWTWPFGHVWKENTYTLMHLIVPESKTCLVCKKHEIYPRGLMIK